MNVKISQKKVNEDALSKSKISNEMFQENSQAWKAN